MANKKIVRLVVGDWSKDGHSRTEEFFVSTIYSIKKIESYFENGSKKINFDIMKYCEDYQENYLSDLQFQPLIEAGYDTDDIWHDEKGYCLTSDVFVDIFLFTVKQGLGKDQDFDLELIDLDSLNIGGYGLF